MTLRSMRPGERKEGTAREASGSEKAALCTWRARGRLCVGAFVA